VAEALSDVGGRPHISLLTLTDLIARITTHLPTHDGWKAEFALLAD